MIAVLADPFTHLVLLLGAIAWCCWGVMLVLTLYHDAPTWRWKAFLITAGGPAVWGVALYRGAKLLRHRVMHHYGVAGYSCCGGHHQ